MYVWYFCDLLCPIHIVLLATDDVYKPTLTGRRDKLPCPKPEDGGVSLWGLLRKNIGKDLSKISMPVTLNEPLSMLQVWDLCKTN